MLSVNGIHEVSGSIPLGSTTRKHLLIKRIIQDNLSFCPSPGACRLPTVYQKVPRSGRRSGQEQVLERVGFPITSLGDWGSGVQISPLRPIKSVCYAPPHKQPKPCRTHIGRSRPSEAVSCVELPCVCVHVRTAPGGDQVEALDGFVAISSDASLDWGAIACVNQKRLTDGSKKEEREAGEETCPVDATRSDRKQHAWQSELRLCRG